MAKTQNIKQKQDRNKFNKDFYNGLHQKKTYVLKKEISRIRSGLQKKKKEKVANISRLRESE